MDDKVLAFLSAFVDGFFAVQRVGGQRPLSGTSIETACMQFGDSNGVMPFDR